MTGNGRNWDKIIDQLKVSRRDFIFSTAAAGVLSLTPRFAGA